MAAEAIGRHISIIVPADKADEFAMTNERLRRGEPAEHLETVWLHRDGTRRDVAITVSPIFDRDRRISGISKVARDIRAQKLTEKSLRDAQATAESHLARLQAVFASMIEGVIVSDHAGNMLVWNAAALQFHGQTEMDVVRQPLAWFANHYELTSLDGAPMPLSEWPLARVLRGETLIGWECSLRFLDVDRHRIVSYSGAPVRGVGGEVEQAVLTIHDVTERKQAEQESVMLRSIIEFCPDFIALTRLDQRVIFVNRAGRALVGLDEGEDVGRTSVSDYHPAEEVDRIEREVNPILRSGGYLTGEVSFRHFRTGAVIPAEWNVFAIPGRDGSPAFFACVAQDITDRKRSERELRESEERYRRVVEDQTDLLCRFLPDGTLTFVNEVFCRLHGKRAEVLIGRPWQPIAHPDDLTMIEDQLAVMSRANPVVVIENRVFDAARQVRWMEFTNHGIYDLEGNLAEIQAVGRDITDRKRIGTRPARERGAASATDPHPPVDSRQHERRGRRRR